MKHISNCQLQTESRSTCSANHHSRCAAVQEIMSLNQMLNPEGAEADSVEMAERGVDKGDEVGIEVHLGHEKRVIGSVVRSKLDPE
jgi:hypothetical protein